jgi:2-C-methyl-D-erythritol 2,4-cyclodiphosphate synthase
MKSDNSMRIGFGYDVHQFTPNRPLWLGGIEVPYEQGLLGHSDADVVIHALCDALLGAAAMRDIGYHFPDTKGNEFEGIDSKILLRRVMEMLRQEGYELGNCDITICAQAPKLNPHIEAMQTCLADVMACAPRQVSIKATTTEHLGFVGRKEGIAAYAVALIHRTDTHC